MAKEEKEQEFLLEIPLDASQIEDFKPDQDVKVLVRGAGRAASQIVKLDAQGHATVKFKLSEPPGPLAVLLGPAEATDEELTAIETLSVNVGSREWAGKRQLRIPPILIPPFWWHRWPFWCRKYVIRGRVLCPDGSPVPAAQVCAYDVDWWFWWLSKQQIGCATTDINGSFEIRFRWCCWWWPWWWWRHRIWELNPHLLDRIAAILRRYPEIGLLGPKGHLPSLEPFRELLGPNGPAIRRALEASDIGLLESIRERLLKKLPHIPEMEALRIWPWWPWWPWRDCAPDVIFKVTQNCLTPGEVIVNETFADTRWNITSPLDVTLTATESACCISNCPQPPCEEGECLEPSEVCALPVNDIAGNLGSPIDAPSPPGPPPGPLVPSPLLGLYRPGAVAPGVADYNSDRPFAGTVPVKKVPVTMLNVDYYEIQYLVGGIFVPLPPGACVDFLRRWIHNVPGFPTGDVPFIFTPMLDAASNSHLVVESKEHFEAAGGLAGWGFNRFWLYNEYLVVPIDTTKFLDGTYSFQVVGWQIAGGKLVNPRPLPVCGSQQQNYWMLTFDNRTYDQPTHPASHHCGEGVHICTQEPDTHISAVRINGQPVDPCDTVDAAAGDLEVDFQVTDSDGYLAVYTLVATYGLSQSVNLLNLAGAVVTVLGAGQSGWAAPGSNATYGVALSQGAVAPHWYGGHYRLTVPASQAFPQPCCYQLELRGYKRTIAGGGGPLVFSCDTGYPYWNLTEYTLGVGVCPPIPVKPVIP